MAERPKHSCRTSILALVAGLALCSCGGATYTVGDPADMGPAQRFPDAPGPDACGEAPLVGLDELAGGGMAGRTVAVEGVPLANVRCTMLQCGEDECCNTCEGEYDLRTPDPERHRVILQGLEGCSGYECAYDCKPFGREPQRRYRFVGRHEHHPAGETSTYALSIVHLERYCRAAPR